MALIKQTDTRQWVIDVDATFINLAENLLVVDVHGQSVRLRVSAAPSVTEEDVSSQATCQFDLSGMSQGTHRLAVQAGNVSLPKGVSLLEPVTTALTIRLEQKISKTVDVVADLAGDPSPGFAVATVRLKPDRVRLTGTAAMLDALDTVRTRSVSLEGAAESFRKEIPLNLPEDIVVDPPSRIVVAEVEIQERMITRRLENIPLSARGAPNKGYRIDPEGITLTVNGPESIVGKLESNPDFSVTINLEGLPPGIHSLKAAIKLPLHTTLVQVTPELFSVTISKQ